MAASVSPTYVYVGTYTTTRPHAQGTAEGIYVFQHDSTTGGLMRLHVTPGIVNPSYLTVDPSGRYLYAVAEVRDTAGRAGGSVAAYAIDPATGALRFLNQQPSLGADPCHLSVEQTGRYVLVANYTSGSVAMFPIQADGSLAPASDFHQHVGSSVNPERQEGPHAHSITVDPTNRFAVVADLGLDRVLVYRLDLDRGKLVPHDPPGAAVAPGAGPRHVDFHPNGRFLYVINEIGSTLTVFAYDAERGTLAEVQTVPTLPSGFTGRNHCADIHVHPSGRFVYGSNRGHDSIAIFRIDAETGRLTVLGHEPTGGQTPRNFAIDPTGTFLYAANQNTDTIVVFRIDPESGLLQRTGVVVAVPTPVCVKFRVV
ncbi:MAG: lactonase family protein [Chloroflexi bacterium]|nr:lactonase family protein [Chloroflexota bacterium]